ARPRRPGTAATATGSRLSRRRWAARAAPGLAAGLASSVTGWPAALPAARPWPAPGRAGRADQPARAPVRRPRRASGPHPGRADADGLLAGPRRGHVLPSVQESADLGLAVTAVTAGGPDRRQLAAPGPPGDGLRVDPKHRGNLGRGQKTILRLDLGSHDGWSSRAWG